MEQDLSRPVIQGRNLRYLLTDHLFGIGRSLTVVELADVVRSAGFAMLGRPSKVVSDALRLDVAAGRVVRIERGRYGPGTMPKQTRSWRRRRVVDFGRTSRQGDPGRVAETASDVAAAVVAATLDDT